MSTTTPTSPSTRPFLAATLVALLASLALLAGACSNDGEKSDSTTTTASDEESDSTTTAADEESGQGDQGTDPAEDGTDSTAGGDFETQVAAATKELEAAEDPCAVFDAVGTLSQTPDPTTADEVRSAVDYYVALLNKMADTSSDPALADTFRTGATEFADYAESVDYDPAKMDLSGEGPDLPSMEAVNTAFDTYFQSSMADCMPDGLEAPTSTP